MKHLLHGGIGTVLGFGSIYLAATAIVNIGYYGLQAGIEAIERAPEGEVVATIGEVDYWRSHNDMNLGYAKATLDDGSPITLVDSPRVLEGKWLPNRIVDDLEIGKKYRVKTIDSFMGDVMLSVTASTKGD